MNIHDPQKRGASCLGKNFPKKFKKAQTVISCSPWRNHFIYKIIQRKICNHFIAEIVIRSSGKKIGYITVENKPYYYA